MKPQLKNQILNDIKENIVFDRSDFKKQGINVGVEKELENDYGLLRFTLTMNYFDNTDNPHPFNNPIEEIGDCRLELEEIERVDFFDKDGSLQDLDIEYKEIERALINMPLLYV